MCFRGTSLAALGLSGYQTAPLWWRDHMRSALQKLQPHLASDLAEYTERENTVHDISSVVWMDGFGSCGPHIVSGAGRARVFFNISEHTDSECQGHVPP